MRGGVQRAALQLWRCVRRCDRQRRLLRQLLGGVHGYSAMRERQVLVPRTETRLWRRMRRHPRRPLELRDVRQRVRIIAPFLQRGGLRRGVRLWAHGVRQSLRLPHLRSVPLRELHYRLSGE
jgi:hypothetical protein